MKNLLKYLGVSAVLIGIVFFFPVQVYANTYFSQLAVSEDLSPEERFAKKSDLTKNALSKAMERVRSMQETLTGLSFDNDSLELRLRNQYLQETKEYLFFYEEKNSALAGVVALEELDLLIQDVMKYRETIYASSAKNILEFILVFSYNPSVLSKANERFFSIRADIERLEKLNLIEKGLFEEFMTSSQNTLEEVVGLQENARSLLLNPHLDEPLEIEAILDIKELSEQGLNKIRELYNIFMETGQKVKTTLGI